MLNYRVKDGATVATPARRNPARADDLWRTTCFEAFLMREGETGYYEFNFSPSTEWAAYRFERYREAMALLQLDAPPHMEVHQGQELVVVADLDLGQLPKSALALGLSAVIEELDGTKSYWALRHPMGDKPYFHHPDCFAIELPSASGA